MSEEYVKELQDAARNPKPATKDNRVVVNPNASDLPYHTKQTEAVQAERTKK